MAVSRYNTWLPLWDNEHPTAEDVFVADDEVLLRTAGGDVIRMKVLEAGRCEHCECRVCVDADGKRWQVYFDEEEGWWCIADVERSGECRQCFGGEKRGS